MNESGLKTRILHKDFICDNVFEKIKKGILKPGDRITELQLAKEFQVSQAPVREALRDLEAMGLIESIPFRGNYVKKLTYKELCDFYRVRSGLEIVAVKYAIKKMTDEDISELEKILKKMNQAGESGNTDEFVEYDVMFHQYLVEKADNKELLKMWNTTHIRTWTELNTRVSRFDKKQLAMRHNSIFEAIMNRNIPKACQEVELHLEELIQELGLSDNDELNFQS